MKFAAPDINFHFSLKQLGDYASADRSLIITDSNLWVLYQHFFNDWNVLVLPAGEEAKSWLSLQQILERCMDLQLDRQSTIIGFGGGVITDVAALAAAVFKRGLHALLIPTSLLAMVDASIGGKSAINFLNEKNIIGTIRQADAILFDEELLLTLPLDEWKNGMAEVVKHAVLQSSNEIEYLLKAPSFPFTDLVFLRDLIQRNVKYKSSIVEHDEKEIGQRKILNFGHTIGHAIESAYKYPHGLAISLGMVCAAELSEQLLDFSSFSKVISLLRKFGLPLQAAIEVEQLLPHIVHDKKKKDGHVDFILLKDFGQPVIHPIAMGTLSTLLTGLKCLKDESRD